MNGQHYSEWKSELRSVIKWMQGVALVTAQLTYSNNHLEIRVAECLDG
jgi:hypothetical protein